MKGRFLFVILAMLLQASCTTKQPTEGLRVDGYWLKDSQGQVMVDPQTSGLAKWRGGLITIADGSADPVNRLKIINIDPQHNRFSLPASRFSMSPKVKASCFAEYLLVEPDFEALVVDPSDQNVVFLVTEDARRTGFLSADCQAKFAQTGSTEYPTLLVRVEIGSNGSAVMTHVRPLQYKAEFNVGDAANDGIEGLAMGKERTLYFGLEKDAEDQPRVFSVKIDDNFWQAEDFFQVQVPDLKLPTFDSGNHPINGMDIYQHSSGKEYLLAAARNDDQLWVIDLSGEQETQIIDLTFMAETGQNADNCPPMELMNNASIEGVAVDGETLWLVNDPWKVNYYKNIQCENVRANYEKMAPLLFKVAIEPDWFTSIKQ